MTDTNVVFFEKDIGKNLYRKKTYYTICVEQDVLAKDKDEADNLLLEDGGIDYDMIRTNLTHEKNGVETLYLDCNYVDSENTEYMGKVSAEYDDEYKDEIIDVVIDELADEVENEKAINDYVKENAEQNG